MSKAELQEMKQLFRFGSRVWEDWIRAGASPQEAQHAALQAVERRRAQFATGEKHA